MATITLSGNSYFSYASISEANIFLVPDLNYATWSALSADQQGALLISASRFIDSLSYIDAADTQTERELIPAFADAAILIASLLSTGSTAILGGTVAEAETKRLKASSVELEYFRGPSFYSPSAYSNWPQNILILLRPYLKSYNSGLGFGAASFGTCGTSPLNTYEILND